MTLASLIGLAWGSLLVGFLCGAFWVGSRRDNAKDRLVELLAEQDAKLRLFRSTATVDQLADLQQFAYDSAVLAEIEAREFGGQS